MWSERPIVTEWIASGSTWTYLLLQHHTSIWSLHLCLQIKCNINKVFTWSTRLTRIQQKFSGLRRYWNWLKASMNARPSMSPIVPPSCSHSPQHTLTYNSYLIIPPYGSMGAYLVYYVFVCLFVQLRISQRQKKIAAWNFTRLFDYYWGRSSPILVNVGSRGVTAAALRQGWAIYKWQWGSRNWAPWLGGQPELGAPIA